MRFDAGRAVTAHVDRALDDRLVHARQSGGQVLQDRLQYLAADDVTVRAVREDHPVTPPAVRAVEPFAQVVVECPDVIGQALSRVHQDESEVPYVGDPADVPDEFQSIGILLRPHGVGVRGALDDDHEVDVVAQTGHVMYLRRRHQLTETGHVHEPQSGHVLDRKGTGDRRVTDREVRSLHRARAGFRVGDPLPDVRQAHAAELAALNPWQTGLPQRDIVANPAPLFQQLRRVRYDWRTGSEVTLKRIATEAATHGQALMVVNGTKDASHVHNVWLGARDEDPGTLHLSTRMTGGHRREIIQAAKQRLDAGLDTLLVSTSLIEAGVDLDFPRGYRARSLPESEQQAAGRINREGHRPTEDSIMTVFEPTDGLQPQVIYNRCGIAAASRRFGKGLADPDDLDTLRSYYQHRYRLQAGRSSTDPNGATGEAIEALREKLDYPETARKMRVIDNEHSVAVVAIRLQLDQHDRQVAQDAIKQLRSGLPTPETYRKLQDHMASIPQRELETAINAGHAVEIAGDLCEWTGPYHPQRGIEPAVQRDGQRLRIPPIDTVFRNSGVVAVALRGQPRITTPSRW
ncbi:hypothetical protein ACFZDI_11285 [Streptomyces sp. NPDC007907]|uniref:hypothetical protein n=1 Tax=Streptomyces sp. NPDC007907 TaxID=3364789 RepID=UPI0036E7B562